ncbi:MAG: ribosome-associated translation inhibitor RaiA [Phycisphaeraceae bacterium]
MDMKISGKHMDVTDAIREYIERKAGRLPRYFDRIQEIVVILEQHDRKFEVEILLHIEHHDPIIAKHTQEDLYACVDQSVDKAERQLTDLKERLRNRKHNV